MTTCICSIPQLSASIVKVSGREPLGICSCAHSPPAYSTCRGRESRLPAWLIDAATNGRWMDADADGDSAHPIAQRTMKGHNPADQVGGRTSSDVCMAGSRSCSCRCWCRRRKGAWPTFGPFMLLLAASSRSSSSRVALLLGLAKNPPAHMHRSLHSRYPTYHNHHHHHKPPSATSGQLPSLSYNHGWCRNLSPLFSFSSPRLFVRTFFIFCLRRAN